MLRIAGQHYRIHGDPAKGLPYLFKAARMPFPDRSVFNWHHLYKCLSKLELGRAVTSLGDDRVTLAELKEAAQLIAQVLADVLHFTRAFFAREDGTRAWM
jgi:hypothetical protein